MIFEPYAELVGHADHRLVAEAHALFQRRVVAADEVGPLVNIQSDAMAGTMRQTGQVVVGAEAVRFERAPRSIVNPPTGSAKGRMRWAQLLKRVFDIDIERCPHCGGQLKLIAAIEEPAVIQRILTHLGLAAQPPPRAAAVRVDLLQAA